MADLLDASVWLPLTAAGHVHHRRAVRYWMAETARSVAFCRVTVLALVRHVSNRLIMGVDAQSAGGAWHIYERWRALPEVVLLPEPEGVDLLLADWSQSLPLDSRDWTDAYLAAFAIAGGHRLVAFDQGFRRFEGLDLLHLVA